MPSANLAITIAAHDQANKTIHGMVAPLHHLSESILDVGKVAAGVALGGLFAQLGGGLASHVEDSITKVVSLSNETRKLQGIIGGSTETTSQLLAVFERFGIDAEGAGKSLGILSKHMAGLEDDEDGVMTGGKKFNDVMDSMGVAFLGVNGLARPMNDVLLDLADKFQKMGPSADRTAIAMSLFGKSGKDMLPMLNLGKEGMLEAESAAKKYGLSLSGDNVEAVRQFGLAHKDLDEAMSGITVTIGTLVMPIMAALARTVASLAQQFNEKALPAIKAFAAAISDKVGPPIQAVGVIIKEFLGYLDPANKTDVMRNWFGPDWGPRIDEVTRGIEGMIVTIANFVPQLVQFDQGVIAAVAGLVSGGGIEQMLADLNDYFVEAFNISPGEVVAKLQGWGQGVLAWITAQVPIVEAQLKGWGQAFIDWVTPIIPPAIAKLNEIITSIEGWIVTQGPVIVAQLQVWGQAILDWISVQSAPIIAKLGEWKDAFIAWIVPATQEFLAQWPGMLNKFLDWIETAVPPILLQLASWAGAFISWIVPMLPDLMMALAGILAMIIVFIAETVLTIGERLLKWAAAFIVWIVPMIPGFVTELGKIGDAINDWMKKQAGIIATAAYDWGVQLIKNFIAGAASEPFRFNIAGSIITPPTGGLFGPGGAFGGPPIPSSSSGNTSAPLIGTLNVTGSTDPMAVRNQANQGVMAAARALGYN